MNPAALASKRKNMENIIRYIIRNGEALRQELALELSLSTATITNIINELMELGLIYEGRKDDSAVGRKAKMLKFNSKIYYFLSISIQTNDILNLSICDLSGSIITNERINMPFKLTADNTDIQLINNLSKHIENFIKDQAEGIRKKLLAGAVSIPGLVNYNQTVQVPIFNWNNLPIIDTLKPVVNVPIFGENVARLKATYEMRYVDEQEKNVIYLSLSPGVGMVNFFGGKMIRGRTNICGEVGHMTLDINGEPCYCGNRGCIEVYCGEQSILRQSEELISGKDDCKILKSLYQESGELTIDLLFKARKMGSIKVHHLFAQVATYLGAALANIFNCLDPDRIIISGKIVEDDDFLISLALEEAKNRVLNRFTRDFKVSKARLKAEDIESGVSAFLLNTMIDTIIP